MKPVKPIDANAMLSAPPGMADSCVALHVYQGKYSDGTPFMCSLWDPNETERTALLAGLPVLLTVVGDYHPPVGLGVARELDQILEKKQGVKR